MVALGLSGALHTLERWHEIHSQLYTYTQAMTHTQKPTMVFMLEILREYFSTDCFLFSLDLHRASKGPVGFYPNDEAGQAMGYRVTKTEKPTYCSCPLN